MQVQLLLMLLAALSAQLTESARILAAFPHYGKSHYFMFRPFVHELARRGHQVTVLTHFPEDDAPPGVSFVNIRRPEDTIIFNTFDMGRVEMGSSYTRSFFTVIGLRAMGLEVCETVLSHPAVQEFLKSKKEFDVSIIEFFNTDCVASLAHVFQTPIIGIFSSVMMPWHNERFGNPDNPAYIGNHFLQVPSRMGLLERLANTIATIGSKIAYRWMFDPPADALVKKYVGDNVPPVRDIVNNASLFLINTHFSLFQPRPFVPGIIELGGFHVTPPQGKIPADVLKFIEESRDGVIFFSMGSSLRGSTMPQAKVALFQQVFSKLRQRVLWKWEEDVMTDKPDNVMIGKWFPQNDILGHKNVKVFVTHSGLMGTEEAVYHGVPMVMLPVFGDQPLNAASCAEKGIGVIVDYYTLSHASLSQAIEQVLYDKSYTESAKRLAKIFVDRPLSIMETAIYWTEYVIRYQGAPHLRSAAADLTWYQYLLLDVLALVALAIYVPIRLFIAFLRWGKSKCSSKSQKPSQAMKKKRQ